MIAAISVSGPADRVPEERIAALAVTVQEHASMVSYRLGYDDDPAQVAPLG